MMYLSLSCIRDGVGNLPFLSFILFLTIFVPFLHVGRGPCDICVSCRSNHSFIRRASA